MTEREIKAGLMLWHRGLGLAAAVFLIVAALTGFLLLHPEWLESGPPAPGAVAADPRQEDRLLRGVPWGVEESRDGGATWRELPMLAPPTDVTRIHFSAGDPARIFALGPATLVTSADGGRIWEEVALPADLLDRGARLRDVSAGPEGAWYLLTTAGTAVTFDGGASWTPVGAEHHPGPDWAMLLHDLHTGQVLGTAGRRVVEAAALTLVVLTVSGLLLSFRRRRNR